MNERNRQDAPDWTPEEVNDFDARMGVYAKLRRSCPLALSRAPGTGGRVWTVMRHADIHAVVRDVHHFSNGKRRRLEGRRPPLESDPPEHPQIRRLVQAFFSPQRMAEFRPVTEAYVAELLAPILAVGAADFAADLARPLPAQVLLTWLGQPKEDWEDIKLWSDAIRPKTFTDVADGETFAEADAALWSYSRDVVADRQARPRDPAADPVSAMLAGRVDDAPIDAELVAGVVRLLVAAGHDSTTQAIGICLHHLATHPGHQAELRANPARIKVGIEEILRFATPIVAMPRIVAQDIELHGRKMVAGDRVMLNWASANRDPDAFDHPEECRLDRRPNPHVVFGSGIHTCLGAPLARQEILVTLEQLLAATCAFELAGEPVVSDMRHFGYETLPCKVIAAN